MRRFIMLIIVTFFANLITAWDFVPALDLSGSLTYPTLVTAEDLQLDKKIGGAVNLATSFMTNSDIAPSLWLIPTLTVDYSSTAQPLDVEDEQFMFSQWFDLYLSYGLNYEFSKAWEIRARGFSRLDYAQQTADEQFGKGLYDYRDNGLYFENAITLTGEKGGASEITVGFKYTDRRFPNYTSLLTGLAPGELGYDTPNTYTKEKDNLIYDIYASDNIAWSGSKWGTSVTFTYEYTPYTDQAIIESDGSFSPQKKDRQVCYIGGGISLRRHRDIRDGYKIHVHK